MRTKLWLCILAAFCALAAGCGSLPGLQGSNDETGQVASLINYSQLVAAMPADEQRREFNVSTQDLGRDPTAYARIRLALLLMTPGAGFADDARALALLEPLVAPNPPATPGGSLRKFAALLRAQAGERLREQKRSAQLKEQLDAMKAVERALTERDIGRTR